MIDAIWNGNEKFDGMKAQNKKKKMFSVRMTAYDGCWILKYEMFLQTPKTLI